MNFHEFVVAFSLLFSSHTLVDEVKIIHLSPALCKITSTQVADGTVPKPEDVAKDAYCISLLMKTHAPRGAVTIFGSARTSEIQESYKITREFARLWTQEHGSIYPVLTGGGLGIMEAGNRGASDAGGASLSIATAFTGAGEKSNRYSTHSYLSASFSERESALVDYAAAIVVAPGGFGTEWEIYETLSKIQTHKKNAVPVVLLGGKKAWVNLLLRIEDMKVQKTIAPADVDLIFIAESPESAFAKIEKFLLK